MSMLTERIMAQLNAGTQPSRVAWNLGCAIRTVQRVASRARPEPEPDYRDRLIDEAETLMSGVSNTPYATHLLAAIRRCQREPQRHYWRVDLEAVMTEARRYYA